MITETEKVTKPELLTTPCIDHGLNGDKYGYGNTSYLGKSVKLHRLAYMKKYCITNLPSWAHIMHVCDNPRCINPEHLQLGNAKLNALDKAQKGRIKPMLGDSNGRAKLNEYQVREIYTKYTGGGYTQRRLAKEYGVSPRLLLDIVKGRLWKHLNLKG